MCSARMYMHMPEVFQTYIKKKQPTNLLLIVGE